MSRPRPSPPHPGLVRRPQQGFGWIDDLILHDRWLAELGPDATSVLVLFALAADRYGASFYGRARMIAILGINLERIDRALDRLLRLRLVALKPWREGQRDGVWQLLLVPRRDDAPRAGRALSAAQVLKRMGLGDP